MEVTKSFISEGGMLSFGRSPKESVSHNFSFHPFLFAALLTCGVFRAEGNVSPETLLWSFVLCFSVLTLWSHKIFFEAFTQKDKTAVVSWLLLTLPLSGLVVTSVDNFALVSLFYVIARMFLLGEWFFRRQKGTRYAQSEKYYLALALISLSLVTLPVFAGAGEGIIFFISGIFLDALAPFVLGGRRLFAPEGAIRALKEMMVLTVYCFGFTVGGVLLSFNSEGVLGVISLLLLVTTLVLLFALYNSSVFLQKYHIVRVLTFAKVWFLQWLVIIATLLFGLSALGLTGVGQNNFSLLLSVGTLTFLLVSIAASEILLSSKRQENKKFLSALLKFITAAFIGTVVYQLGFAVSPQRLFMFFVLLLAAMLFAQKKQGFFTY